MTDVRSNSPMSNGGTRMTVKIEMKRDLYRFRTPGRGYITVRESGI